MSRIRALPSGVANHVRASQVIGSVERGVEELLQNAILHGAARSLSVTMGEHPNSDFVIVVEDDGVGIDNVSMRTLIGTEACCNDAFIVFGNQGRGDSLRSIASLCVECKIESTFESKNGKNISSTKVIQNGVTVSYEDSTGHWSSSSSVLPSSARSIATNNRTGTRITLRNMFQQFAVRRKYHHSRDLLAEVRTVISMLALAYPLVSFKLVNGENGKVDLSFDSLPSNDFSTPLTCRVLRHNDFSAKLKDEANALAIRMDKMNTNDDFLGRRAIQLTGEDGNVFRAFGVILLSNGESDCSGRKMQIAINGRPATQTKRLAEIVQDKVKKCFGSDICECAYQMYFT